MAWCTERAEVLKLSKWMVYTKKADFNGISAKYKIDPVIARIIRNRDIVGDDEINMYLNGTIKDMHNPALLKDGEKAADIIINKIKEKKKIRIIGDYDIDGICSTSILYKGLTIAGADVDYDVPDRITDGYGININLINKAIESNVDTIITCDNGIAAADQVIYAKDNNMTVIVTDHHDVPYTQENGEKQYIIPQADAVVNPKQADCKYPFKLLCGAGVAYKLIILIFNKLGIMASNKELLDELKELMAIATVGDIVDLVDENRVVVKYGLRHLAKTKNVGINALIEACELDRCNISAYHIGFVLGPCLNASGRLETALTAIKLVLEDDQKEAEKLAMKLRQLNDERKQMTENETLTAIDMVENSELVNDNVIVLYLSQCHESIAGIIAGRIKEHFYKPAIVLTEASDGGAKGSARSIEGYNMFEEISKCKELLTKFGGHPMAAGMSLPKENIDAFRKRLNELQTLTPKELTPVMWIDVPMPLDYVSMKLVEQLKVIEPFGKGNEKPVFADKNLTVRYAGLIGKNSNVLKMKLETQSGMLVDAVKFNASMDYIPLKGDKISVVYYPDINEYKGRRSLQFIILEINQA